MELKHTFRVMAPPSCVVSASATPSQGRHKWPDEQEMELKHTFRVTAPPSCVVSASATPSTAPLSREAPSLLYIPLDSNTKINCSCCPFSCSPSVLGLNLYTLIYYIWKLSFCRLLGTICLPRDDTCMTISNQVLYPKSFLFIINTNIINMKTIRNLNRIYWGLYWIYQPRVFPHSVVVQPQSTIAPPSVSPSSLSLSSSSSASKTICSASCCSLSYSQNW